MPIYRVCYRLRSAKSLSRALVERMYVTATSPKDARDKFTQYYPEYYVTKVFTVRGKK